ncbi:uncharacterized protein LOC105663877 isoform X4 [Megachile rotundata]|uniref:uncharacterized protein LOC105663877 isoform X4 n=1 Tax=Megachile rotundata TaxID=143995 RepID=UPI003FD4387C
MVLFLLIWRTSGIHGAIILQFSVGQTYDKSNCNTFNRKKERKTRLKTGEQPLKGFHHCLTAI